MKEKIRKLILFICVCVFLYSAFQLGKIFYDYYMIEKETTNLVENYVQENNEEEEKEDPLRRIVNFDSLWKVNKDVIGWVYIPDTKIDEPILKGANNDTYLRTDINGKYNIAGTIFIDEINSKDFNDENTIIYGHNMKNGSRFNHLKKFVDKEFFDEHPNVYIYMPDGSVQVYRIYVSRILNAYSDLYQKNIDYKTYTDSIQKSAKQTREIPEEEAPLIMLSTCVAVDNDNRYIISARLEETIKP